MKYLGIDYGEKRIGVAVSDDDGKFAFAFDVVENKNAKILEYLKNLIVERQIGIVVLGLPLGFSMQETKSTKRVRNFGYFLKKELGVEIIFQNEVLSSKEVEKAGSAKKGMIDASSAALILQSFLDSRELE